MSDIQLALLFPYIPFSSLVVAFALVELITDNDEDDDNDRDGGILQSVSVPT